MKENYPLEAAEDLLARTILVHDGNISKQFILNNMNRFESAGIIQGMIKRNMIVGNTNKEVYYVYFHTAKDIGIEPLSSIDFSRTLCKYYGFELFSTSKNGKSRRVYRKRGYYRKTDRSHIMESIACYLIHAVVTGEIIGKTLNEQYERYSEWCIDNCKPIGSKSTFKNLFSFAKFELKQRGEDDGDDSSGQESLG